MNDMLIRAFVRQVIAEAKAKKEKKVEPKKKEDKLPKSSGKLMDLKKEIAYLREMSEQLQATGLTEGSDQVVEVEFANLQKFVNELKKVKEAGAALKTKLDEEITSIEEKIKSEKNKIKEMIGLVSEEPKTPVVGEELDEAKKKPSAGMTKKEKSSVVKKAKKGEDIGKKGKGFEKVAKAAGGGEKGKKIAAAAMWKQQAK